MASKEEIALMAHLMRRAGFGATREELECLAGQGYEATVEELLHPERQPEVDEYLLYRYLPMTEVAFSHVQGVTHWLHYMLHTRRPLQEKMALFCHQLFATGDAKVDAPNHMIAQIQMFRDHSMDSYKELLVRLATDPAMIFWLDNSLNHKGAPNENWGRELLELFSMGVGNYTESDVFECSRAFTGWTISAKIPSDPYGRFYWRFAYRPEDHDSSEKTFLGNKGRFNGEDIIDIIIQQPACHTFIARHLYNFFVADEPPVPLWPTEPPRDPDAVRTLSEAFVNSGYEMKPVLRTLFNSDFFKDAMYQKVKSPIEVFVSTIRLTRDLEGPDPGVPTVEPVAKEAGYMGQTLLQPPSVEGWHTGQGWINSGTLAKRINFVTDRVSNSDLPGVRDIVNRVASEGTSMTPDTFIERCLDLIGPLRVDDSTRAVLEAHVETGGPLSWDTDEGVADLSRRVGDTLALIVSTREYQFG